MTGPRHGPIDVLLADGGHLIVAFADAGTEADPRCDAIVAELVLADGSEDDLGRAVVSRATAGGLSATISGSGHPTTIVIAGHGPLERDR